MQVAIAATTTKSPLGRLRELKLRWIDGCMCLAASRVLNERRHHRLVGYAALLRSLIRRALRRVHVVHRRQHAPDEANLALCALVRSRIVLLHGVACSVCICSWLQACVDILRRPHRDRLSCALRSADKTVGE